MGTEIKFVTEKLETRDRLSMAIITVFYLQIDNRSLLLIDFYLQIGKVFEEMT